MTPKQLTMSFVSRALAQTAFDAYARTHTIASSLALNIAVAVALPPAVSAQEVGYVRLDTPDHTYSGFVSGPITDSTPDADKILADTNSFAGYTLDWPTWKARADQIRINVGDRRHCYGNLPLALNGLGATYQAGAAGATTLLTLLPTAGALIGAPAREL